MTVKLEGVYTYHTIYDINGRGPAIKMITKRIIVRHETLMRDLKQWHMLKLVGYRPRILYGINCRKGF